MSAIEFGVAGGNGPLFLEQFAARVERGLGVRIELYGFDTGDGLPNLGASEDMPYWFRRSQYRMDVDALRPKLTRARLVLGDVRETVDTFFNQYNPAPVVGMLFALPLSYIHFAHVLEATPICEGLAEQARGNKPGALAFSSAAVLAKPEHGLFLLSAAPDPHRDRTSEPRGG